MGTEAAGSACPASNLYLAGVGYPYMLGYLRQVKIKNSILPSITWLLKSPSLKNIYWF